MRSDLQKRILRASKVMRKLSSMKVALRKKASKDYRLSEIGEIVQSVLNPKAADGGPKPTALPAKPPIPAKQAQQLMMVVSYGIAMEQSSKLFKQQQETGELAKMLEALGKALQGRDPQGPSKTQRTVHFQRTA